jgi:hypothetical protein
VIIGAHLNPNTGHGVYDIELFSGFIQTGNCYKRALFIIQAKVFRKKPHLPARLCLKLQWLVKVYGQLQ